MAYSNPLIVIDFYNKIRFNILIIFLVIVPTLAYLTPGSSQVDAFLYFFSTNAQILAAIVALMGTYLIFRINLIDIKIDSLATHISAVIEKITKESYSPLAIRRIVVEDLLQKIPENNRHSVRQLFQEYEQIKKVRENNIDIAKFPVLYTLFSMFSSVILIYAIPFFYADFIGRFFIYLEVSMSLWCIIECANLLNVVLRINPLS